MMKKRNPLTFYNHPKRFDVFGDKKLFYSIVKDMIEHGGDLMPSEHWKLCNWHKDLDNKADGYTEELFERNYSQLKMMLDPWVGVSGMKPIDSVSVSKYEYFLKQIDKLGLLPDDILPYGESNGWLETDLGTIMDINLIFAFAEISHSDRILVCEVGGGYGRLAEIMLNGICDSMHYVLVDAVPGSLMYAYLYLKNQLPDLKIGAFFVDDKYDDSYDCYILPAWHSNLLEDSVFDVCINIESMQEMEQFHVDYYIDLFDRISVEYGLIYLSNARDYVFKGSWSFPEHWETLFLGNTPRSWSANHPTHILQKKNKDYSFKRSIMEVFFQQQIASWHKDQTITELNQRIDMLNNQLVQSNSSLVRKFRNRFKKTLK